MITKKKTKVQLDYENACRAYALMFAEKHDFDYDDDCWVGGDFGGILMLGDFYFNFQEIKYDIDCDIDKDEIFKYYDYNEQASEFNIGVMNYESWCKGCPRTSEEVFVRLRALKQELDDLVKQENENNRKH